VEPNCRLAWDGVRGRPGENVREVYHKSDIFLRGGSKGFMEGVEWGEKGILEGKRGGWGLFWRVLGGGERSKLCQVMGIF